MKIIIINQSPEECNKIVRIDIERSCRVSVVIRTKNLLYRRSGIRITIEGFERNIEPFRIYQKLTLSKSEVKGEWKLKRTLEKRRIMKI